MNVNLPSILINEKLNTDFFINRIIENGNITITEITKTRKGII